MYSPQFDVIIIGAGLSGIGAAVHLKTKCPTKTFALLEARTQLGGTWALFRYPGIRSDSDMHTLSYHFKPWSKPKTIAEGAEIRQYIEETAREYDISPHIRYHHRVLGLAWSSNTQSWSVQVQRTDTGVCFSLTSRFVMSCAGYYRYDQGYAPHFAGQERFTGRVLHPQHWPADLDYQGKRIIVVGSGATAITLVPALAPAAAHVTMLQRSPSYVMSVPRNDSTGHKLARYIPKDLAYRYVRARNILTATALYQFTRSFPALARHLILNQVKNSLNTEADLVHFIPRYAVWDERLCLTPDHNFFEAINSGQVTVMTDEIDHFTSSGLRLTSGIDLDADIVVTATGLTLQVLGGATIHVDGTPITPATQLLYRGVMLEDVPNFATIFGYTNASWTLKSDLSSDYLCKLINHMDAHGHSACVPRNRGRSGVQGPFVDLRSGYIRRGEHLLPRQGTARPWKQHQNYLLDYAAVKLGKVDDPALQFLSPRTHATTTDGSCPQ